MRTVTTSSELKVFVRKSRENIALISKVTPQFISTLVSNAANDDRSRSHTSVLVCVASHLVTSQHKLNIT